MTIEISNDVRSLFHARLEDDDGTYVIEVPRSEVETGALDAGDTYRVVLAAGPGSDGSDGSTRREERASASTRSGSRSKSGSRSRSGRTRDDHSPPVSEGDELAVVIEDQGDEGDGIARVGPGFIVFVPDTAPGDRARIEITDVTGSYAFGEVVERIDTKN